MVNAIQFLQIKKVVHRDLKPLNVMLDEFYNVKIIDFGDAKEFKDENEEKDNKAQSESEDSFAEDDFSDPELDMAFDENEELENSQEEKKDHEKRISKKKR